MEQHAELVQQGFPTPGAGKPQPSRLAGSEVRRNACVRLYISPVVQQDTRPRRNVCSLQTRVCERLAHKQPIFT